MKKGKIIIIIIMLLIFLGGLALVLYPTVSNYLEEKNQSTFINNYNENVSTLSEEEVANQLALATAYNDSIRGDPIKDPFIAGSGIVIPDNYSNILNFDGIMGYIEIPKIKVYIPIKHGVDEETLQHNIGHIVESALPVGGEGNHSVLCGHRGLTTAKLFTDLDKIVEGDVFYIHVMNEIHAYQVDQISVVLPEDTSKLRYEDGKDLVTLLTCTPYGVNSHRLLVRGTRIPYSEEKKEEIVAETTGLNIDYETLVLIIALAIVGIILIILIIAYISNKKKHKQLAPSFKNEFKKWW